MGFSKERLLQPKYLLCLILVLVLVCAILCAMVRSGQSKVSRYERLVMSYFYSDMREIAAMTQGFLQEPHERQADSLWALYQVLVELDDLLSGPGSVISDKLPSSQGMRFLVASGYVKSMAQAQTDTLDQTELQILQILHENANQVLTACVGPDGRNLNPQLTAEQFCQIVQDVFRDYIEPSVP